jgi:hypothetical protein
MGALVRREDIQDLLDLGVRLWTAISTGHSYNRPSAHARLAVAASTQAWASRRAIVPGRDRISVDHALTRAKGGITVGGIRAPPCSVYRRSNHS